MPRLVFTLVALALVPVAAGCGASAVAGTLLVTTKSEKRSRGAAPLPVVSTVSPAAGSHAGGTPITIKGRSFPPDATVIVGGVTAPSVRVVDAETITALTPASSKAGAVDVVVASLNAGSGAQRDAFTYTNALPSVVITPFGRPQSQNVVVSFTLYDAEGDLIDLRLELDIGAGFMELPAAQVVSGGLTSLSSSPDGVFHALTFDSRALLPEQDAAGVRLRLTPLDRTDGRAGLTAESSVFSIVNNTPLALHLNDPGRDAFNVVVSFSTEPDASHSIRVTGLRWTDLRSGASGPMTIASGQGLGPIAAESLCTSVWDSLTDLGFGNDRLVTVTVTVDDGSSSTSATTQPFFVSNGPLGASVALGFAGTTDAMAVGDLDGDGRPDLAVSGYAGVAFGRNLGRSFATGTSATALPALAPISPPFDAEAPAWNPFMSPTGLPGPLALLDLDGDQRLDLLAADGPFNPGSITPLHANVSLALAIAGLDAASEYRHVIAHQGTLLASSKSTPGRPDVADGVWESAQAPIAARAPHLFWSGSTLLPAAATGDPTLDNVGWFVQSLTAAELDGPADAATTPNDVIILHGLYQLGRAGKGDHRGVVVLRQSLPDSGRLGPPVYLDPTDMGQLPTSAVVADVLGPARAKGRWGDVASAPVGTPDIVVACTGDSSLTFYFQVDLAPSSGPGAPRFASLHLPMSAVTPGTPLGDVSGVAVGDVDGDSLNDLVVTGTVSGTITVLVHDADPTARGSLLPLTGGLLPLRLAAVVAVGTPGLGPPKLADVEGDGVTDLLLPMTLFPELRLFVSAGSAAGGPRRTAVRASLPIQAHELVVVDLDGDGRADALTRSLLGVSVSYQTSPGTLDERFVPIVAGTSPQALRAGDVLGLGSPQIVCASSGDGTVQVFGRDPRQTLALVAEYPVVAPPGSTDQPYIPVDTLLADLTGDGALDVAVLVRNVVGDAGSGSGFGVIPSPLAGSTMAVVRPTPFANSAGVGIAGGDLDGDGIDDVAVTSVGAGGGGLSIFSGGRDLALPLVASRPTAYALGCEVADLDGDGFVDVAVGGSATLIVYYGAAAGLSAEPAFVDANAFYLVGADLDGDGRRDLVVTDPTRSDVQVCLQTAPRTFTVVRLVGGNQCQQPAVGDLDGDGRLDIAVPWGHESVLAVYYQRGGATGAGDRFAAPVIYPASSGPMGCVIVDVDGDGRQDVAVSSRGTSTLNVFLQR